MKNLEKKTKQDLIELLNVAQESYLDLLKQNYELTLRVQGLKNEINYRFGENYEDY